MNISDQFDRLDKLIIDRSTDISKMRGILHSIQEQAEADQKKAAEVPNLKQQLQQLQVENTKLKAEPPEPPRLKLNSGKFPRQPI